MEVFSAIAQPEQEEGHPLAPFVDRRLWVGWISETRVTKDGKANTTKVPYLGVGRKAQSDNPSGWLTLDQALKLAEKIGGSIGIFLGVNDCVPGLQLAGIDLDCCRDPMTGEIADWAIPVIERFRSYTEVSPSGKGVKIFLTYRSAQWEREIKPLLREAKTGRQWKRHADHDHPPGIEMYLTCRYFAVTSDGLPAPYQYGLQVVDAADLKWLTEVYGPRFKGKADPASRLPVSGQPRPAYTNVGGSSDSSRSGRAFAWMKVMHCMGKTYPEARDTLLKLTEDPGVADWAATKGMLDNERELHRVYKNTKPFPGSVDDIIGDMARQFAAEDRGEFL